MDSKLRATFMVGLLILVAMVAFLVRPRVEVEIIKPDNGLFQTNSPVGTDSSTPVVSPVTNMPEEVTFSVNPKLSESENK